MEEILKNAKNDEEALVIIKSLNNLIRKEKSSNKISKFYGLSDKFYIQRMLNPAAQYKYAYVLLDTNNVDPDLTSEFKFGWKVINYINNQPGTISTVSNIRDLVAMRLYPVTMQLDAPVGETGKVYTNNVVNVNNNFTILIEEFAAQSFIGRDGRKFHFALFPFIMNLLKQNLTPAITPPDPYIEFTTSGKANGWFWFKNPITEFSTMTVSIGNPFDLVKPAPTTRILIPIQLVYLAEASEY